MLFKDTGLKVTIQSIHYAFKKLNITYKKSLYAKEQEREDVKLERDKFEEL